MITKHPQENEAITRRATFSEQLEAVLSDIRRRARAQFEYNETDNIPKGIIQPEESIETALRHGIAAAINAISQWNPENAEKYAVEILEDCNCHQAVRYLTCGEDMKLPLEECRAQLGDMVREERATEDDIEAYQDANKALRAVEGVRE